MKIRADQVKPGQIVDSHLVREVRRNPRGCWWHVHLTMEDGRQQCYEPATLVEVG